MQTFIDKYIDQGREKGRDEGWKDGKREGLIGTPKRVAKSFKKLFGGYTEDPKRLITVFDNEGYDEMIIAKDIDFYSTCEHHMLPFVGKAYIGYIPDDKIIGLSKLPHLVEIFSRRMQNQERLTKDCEAPSARMNAEFSAISVESCAACCSSSVPPQDPIRTNAVSTIISAIIILLFMSTPYIYENRFRAFQETISLFSV